MSILSTLVIKDIKYCFKRPADIFTPLILFFLINFIFSFSIADAEIAKQVGAAIIIASIIICNSGHLSRILEKEHESGLLQQIYIISCSPSLMFLSKIISSLLCYCLPSFIFYPISAVFFNLETELVSKIALALIPLSIIIAILNTLLSAITSGIKNGGMVQIILSIPLYIPAIVIALSYIGDNNFNYEVTSSFLTSIFGYIVIIFPVSMILGSMCIKALAED
jgi:heme exporter protein B